MLVTEIAVAISAAEPVMVVTPVATTATEVAASIVFKSLAAAVKSVTVMA